MLTNEYPPDTYGGAGVYVDALVRALRRNLSVEVMCFGGSRADATGFVADPALLGADEALRTLSTNLRMAGAAVSCDVVHSNTWHTALAGHVMALMHGVPHVVTAHSLEPLRPWKEARLGRGYRLSSWAERTAYESAAAVVVLSDAMAADIRSAYPGVDPKRIHVIRPGVDNTVFHRTVDPTALRRLGVEASHPYILYVGRLSRQKGVTHLVEAYGRMQCDVRLVLVASAPDTATDSERLHDVIGQVDGARPGSVTWIRQSPSRSELAVLMSHATVVCTPSEYEPLGLVNLEAMACGTPVVVSDVGGMPEVVEHGRTGLVVPFFSADPEGFQAALAQALDTIVADPHAAQRMGEEGRRRAIADFAWPSTADAVSRLYRSLL
ncbi:glycogen synthase [Streptomyces sp900105245]|uniref:D-inositol 3-phosphate glycosyltransferase n=1 Tax=Streptomyces sp. 900105245 TaxID=3154379 RepID=A0ABV1UKH4_9ACTN